MAAAMVVPAPMVSAAVVAPAIITTIAIVVTVVVMIAVISRPEPEREPRGRDDDRGIIIIIGRGLANGWGVIRSRGVVIGTRRGPAKDYAWQWQRRQR